MITLEEIERTCVLCGKVFRQEFKETLKCLCADCRRGKIKEVKTNGPDNCDNGESGKGL